MSFADLPNYRKGEIYRENYRKWKEKSLDVSGYFPIFQPFKEGYILKDLSGNALKLYVYLGMQAGNKTGETWVTIDTMAKYFEKSNRTISNWLEELIVHNLIVRMQLRYDEPAHTFLMPYGYSILLEMEYQKIDENRERDKG